jgi:hypothetical protein
MVVAVAAVAAIWLLFAVLPDPSVPTLDYPTIRIDATDPWLIGNTVDAFSYAGDNVRILQGAVSLEIDPITLQGRIEFMLLPDDALAVLTADMPAENSVILRMQLEQADAVWTHRAINKASDVGDARLPMTQSRYGGSGTFELRLDGIRQPAAQVGLWSVGDALRQSDGSIRNQGLVFSPLLRDQSVFSDPTRMEFTLLIYDAAHPDAVLLHLVFSDALISEL